MPVYDYVCKDCEVSYEIFVPLKDLNSEIKCPECGEVLERQLSVAAIHIH